MNVLIVDDEPLARSRLRRMLSELPECMQCHIDEAFDAPSARRLLLAGGYQLVLLDIQMPGASGLQFAAELATPSRATSSPAIVFVTAHDEHALAAFDLAAVDYLTKPVRRERLAQTLSRVRALQHGNMVPRQAYAGPEADPFVLPVVDRGAMLRIRLAEILYFRSDNKYTQVRTGDRHYLIDTALSELEDRFTGRFVRTHRSALVATHAIAGLNRVASIASHPADDGVEWAVQIRGVRETLPVSRRQLPIVRNLLRQQWEAPQPISSESAPKAKQ